MAEQLGVPLPSELQVEFSKNREEERELPGGGLLLNDCYNANPVSMRAALEKLRGAVERPPEGRGARRHARARPGRPGLPPGDREARRELGIEQVIWVGELARDYGGDRVATAGEQRRR